MDRNTQTTLVGFGCLGLWLLTEVLSSIYSFKIPEFLRDSLIFGGIAFLGFKIGQKDGTIGTDTK